MNNLQSKLKRQIEIIGLCVCDGRTVSYSQADLASMFGVDEVTIKRDLKDLRFIGIPISSYKRGGVKITGGLNKGQTRELMLNYVGLCYAGNIFDKSTALLIEKQNHNSIGNFVQLQLCVENNLMAKIVYHNHKYEEEERLIKPLLIFHSEGSWRLLTQAESSVKQFHLDKITNVRMTDKKFDRMLDEEFEGMFSNSWGSWIGKERINVKLHFDKTWADRLKNRMLVRNQKMETKVDGSIIFSATVNTLAEIASWIVSRGKGCVVLEPSELRDRVIQIARESLDNYELG
jgi:predicted DNA-binding transcriptional regulator YafY